jgi:RNA polymerase subunit RPABC4/transcription elongation factor Spt4
MKSDLKETPLSEANLCANCDTVHNAKLCPVCASEAYLQLAKIINRERSLNNV